jgi:hypothetical protein
MLSLRTKWQKPRLWWRRAWASHRNGKIAAFRVVARGPGCIPVLEARYRGRDGRRYGWEVWKEDERMEENQEGQMRGRGDNRQGARRPPTSAPGEWWRWA